MRRSRMSNGKGDDTRTYGKVFNARFEEIKWPDYSKEQTKKKENNEQNVNSGRDGKDRK